MSTLHNHHFVGAGSRTQLLPAAGPRSRGSWRGGPVRFRGDQSGDDSDGELIVPVAVPTELSDDEDAAGAPSNAAAGPAATVSENESVVQRIMHEFDLNGKRMKLAEVRIAIGDELGEVSVRQWKRAFKEARGLWDESTACDLGEIKEEVFSMRVDVAIESVVCSARIARTSMRCCLRRSSTCARRSTRTTNGVR